jgi:hypothetical protein
MNHLTVVLATAAVLVSVVWPDLIALPPRP